MWLVVSKYVYVGTQFPYVPLDLPLLHHTFKLVDMIKIWNLEMLVPICKDVISHELFQ